MLVRVTLLLSAALALQAQDPPDIPPTENWNVYFQATSIGQYHGAFDAAYSGPLSLADHPEAEASLTTTLFLGLRPARDTMIYFDPEVAGGRGFSGVNGLADSPNGELPRVAQARPTPYLARLYVTQDIALGDEREAVESDANQLAGSRPARRYSISAGRFSLSDFFDDNRYSHDPRTQFMGWAVMYNGAWDYPADTRGYTWGWVHELHMRRWSVRYASAAMPKVANGLRFDRRLFRDRGDEVEGEWRFKPSGREGAVRALAYQNHADMGTYADALQLAAADRRHAGRDRHAADGHSEIRIRRQRRSGVDAATSASSGGGVGTTARPRASRSRPWIAWWKAVSRLPERAGSAPTIRWPPRSTRAAWRASTRSTWSAAASTF